MYRLIPIIILCLVCSCSPAENSEEETYLQDYTEERSEDLVLIEIDRHEDWLRHSDVFREIVEEGEETK